MSLNPIQRSIAAALDILDPCRAKPCADDWILRNIGGWWVTCQNEHEHGAAVRWAKQMGYLTLRMHYSPSNPQGDSAYELTDAGLNRVAHVFGHLARAEAAAMRDWYRKNSAAPPQNTPLPVKDPD